MKALGRQVLTEFCGCDREVLNNKDTIKACMEHATKIAGAKIVKSVFYLLSPHGVSGFATRDTYVAGIRVRGSRSLHVR